MAEAMVIDATPLVLLAKADAIAVAWLEEAIAREAVPSCAGRNLSRGVGTVHRPAPEGGPDRQATVCLAFHRHAARVPVVCRMPFHLRVA
jgi:hypothetical protein